MIKRDLYVKDGDQNNAYVGVDERERAVDTVLIGVSVADAKSSAVSFNLGEFNDLVVILNEAAKYFGYELVMSPISIRKKKDDDKLRGYDVGPR